MTTELVAIWMNFRLGFAAIVVPSLDRILVLFGFIRYMIPFHPGGLDNGQGEFREHRSKI